MKKKELILMLLVMCGIFLMIFGVMLGFQSIIGLFIEVSFNNSYGPIFMCLKILIGFLLLIPVSILVEAILKYKRKNSKVGQLLSEAIQFIPFFLIMHYSDPFIDIVEFNSPNSEFVYYLLMYLFFYFFGSIEGIVKREDDGLVNKNV